MIGNYFKTAWRALVRNRQATAINVLGLALGIAVFLLIAQYVAFEWSANRFHKNFQQLYRTSIVLKDGNSQQHLPAGFAPVIEQKFPAIQKSVRVAEGIGSGLISESSRAANVFREENISYADDGFFNIFSFPMLAGSGALPANTLALSETVAKKIVGNPANAVGKTVTVSNQFGNTLYTVGGVYKDMPAESDIKAGVVLSLETLRSAANRNGNDWANPDGNDGWFVQIYMHVKPGVNATTLATGITQFLHDINPESKKDRIVLQSFHHLHLAPSFDYSLQTFGNLTLVTVFGGIALLILGIAWVNYINLATAQSLKRTKEVGVRKVLGARRGQLVLQYLSETFLITLLAIGLALLLVYSLQPWLNRISGLPLSLRVLSNGSFWGIGAALVLLGGLLSGGYTAFVLSAYKPATTIRGSSTKTVGGFSLRKALVVFQFTVSIVLIIATIVLYRQLRFMQSSNIGMTLDQLLVIKGPTLTDDKQAQTNHDFKTGLAQLSFVTKYAASNNVPGQGYNFNTNGITRPVPQPGDDQKSYAMFISDERFFDTYGIQFVQGQSFTQQDATAGFDKAKKVILNEKAAHELGFDLKETIVGKTIKWGQDYDVIGVIKDYHHLSLREAIQPAIYLPSVSYGYFTIQTGTENLPAKLAQLKVLYAQYYPGNPFDYFFADATFDAQYRAEQQLGKLFIAATAIAVFIACLGLFGLAAIAARQRIKEIGIRKVLGASVADITALLSKDFIRLVALSFVIAAPLAWWAANRWLQGFASRTEVSWWLFALAGLLAVVIALATVSLQSIKAARANPVKNLRTE